MTISDTMSDSMIPGKSVITASSKLESLLQGFALEGKIGGATGIEKAQNLVSYVIKSVPRNYTTLKEHNQLTICPIVAENV